MSDLFLMTPSLGGVPYTHSECVFIWIKLNIRENHIAILLVSYLKKWCSVKHYQYEIVCCSLCFYIILLVGYLIHSISLTLNIMLDFKNTLFCNRCIKKNNHTSWKKKQTNNGKKQKTTFVREPVLSVIKVKGL